MKRYIFLQKIWLVIFISLCFNLLSVAQTTETDTIRVRQERIQNIPFGSQPDWMTTGSLSTVAGTELRKSFTTNLANTLYGRLPGLTVQQYNAEPGHDTPNLLSRGLSTFTSNKILVIVDGFEGTFENLTPHEIESVTLLKDASATAMYGSRAANGVLLVTTKRGERGALKVNFGLQHGYQLALQTPEFLGSYDYARLYNEALQNDGKPELYTEDDLAAYQSGNDPFYHPDVNWYDEVFRSAAPLSNYDLNFSGGSDNVRYFVLLNAITSGGLYKKTSSLSDNSIDSRYSRYNFRSNLDIDLTQRLSATLNLGGSVEEKANPAGNTTWEIISKINRIAPNAFPVYNPNGTYGGSNLYSNPLGDILESGFFTSNSRTLQATFRLTEQLDMIAQGLSISAGVSFNNYFKGYSNKTRQYARFGLSRNETGEPVYTKIGQNTSLEGDETGGDQWRRFELQTLLNYQRTFGKNRIDGVLMFGSDNYMDRVGQVSTINSFPYKHNNAGGRLTYAHNEKYIGEFSFAVNGSENFPEDKRYGFFPAVSLGWIISNEGFLKSSNIVDYLKIRGSYGIVGNDVIGGNRFMFTNVYDYSAGYYIGSTNGSVYGIHQNAYPNENVTWEKSKKMNFGVEASLAKRFDISLDIFNEDRYDILSKPFGTYPGFLGLPLPDLNIGEVNNKGFEAMLRYNSNSEKEFNYSIAANIWYAQNELIYYSETPQQYDYLYRTGHSLAQPFGLEAIGLFKDQADIDASAVQNFSETVRPGDIKYRDMNNDNIIDQLDVHAIGDPSIADLSYSFHTTFAYKGFDLDILFQGVSGRGVYLSGDYYEAFQNFGKVGEIALGRWTPETAATATYPRLSSIDNQNNFGVYSSYWQRNGDYLKVRSLELGYSLPENLISKVKIQNARVYINGTNLFSFDKVEDNDPEIMNGYPAVRTVSIGTSIQF